MPKTVAKARLPDAKKAEKIAMTKFRLETTPTLKLPYSAEGVWGKSFPQAGSKGSALDRRRQFQRVS